MSDHDLLKLTGTNRVSLTLKNAGTCTCGYGCILSLVTLTFPDGEVSTLVSHATEITDFFTEVAATGQGNWESPGHTGFGHERGKHRGLALASESDATGAAHVTVNLSTEAFGVNTPAPWAMQSKLVLHQGAQLETIARDANAWRRAAEAEAAASLKR